ncbi:MAG: AMP-binding protein [Pseudomonadota bacterium]|nr:AMP-binding protein [Pseudomonadota bacterium]
MALKENDAPFWTPDVPRTMVDAFVSATSQAPDHTAIIVGEEQATYAQYRDVAGALANRLGALDIKGERVAVLMENSIEMSAVIYGIWGAGGIIVLLNPLYTERELLTLISDAAPKVVVYNSAFKEKIDPVAVEAGALHRLALGTGGVTWTELSDAGGTYPVHRPGPSDTCSLQYTGGTTGLPKGAQHTHEEIVASAVQMDRCWPGEPRTDIWLNVAPQFHVWGLTMTLLVPVLRHDTVVMTTAFEPDRVLATIPRHKVTLFAGGPAPIFNGLMRHPDFRTTDYSSLRLCGGGGSAIPIETEKSWKAVTGVTIHEAYGMSEGAPISATPTGGINKIGTCGPAVPGTEIRVVDVEDTAKVMGPGEDGEITFRGPQMMKNYWNRPEETEATIRDGWLHTGDIGHLDDDGDVVIVDRKKDMAIVNGFNVFPREIDEVLFSHPELVDAAAVGVPSERTGEVIHAYVVCHSGSTVNAEILTNYCREQLVGYKVPAKVVILDALPKTPAAKTDKRALRERSLTNH